MLREHASSTRKMRQKLLACVIGMAMAGAIVPTPASATEALVCKWLYDHDTSQCPVLVDAPSVIGVIQNHNPTAAPTDEETQTILSAVHPERALDVSNGTIARWADNVNARCRDGSVEFLTCAAAIVYLLYMLL